MKRSISSLMRTGLKCVRAEVLRRNWMLHRKRQRQMKRTIYDGSRKIFHKLWPTLRCPFSTRTKKSLTQSLKCRKCNRIFDSIFFFFFKLLCGHFPSHLYSGTTTQMLNNKSRPHPTKKKNESLHTRAVPPRQSKCNAMNCYSKKA